MIKIIASVLIVFGTVIFGIKKSDELKKRLNWLESFKTSLHYIKEEIRYSFMPVPALIKKLSTLEQFKELFIFQNCSEMLLDEKNFSFAWKRSLDKTLQEVKLQNSDVFVVIAFGEGFGKGDVKSQLSLCERTGVLISGSIEDAKGKYEKYSKLYKMLGLFAGIVVVLLII